MSIWGAGILNGMRITMRNMRRGPITLQYPREKMELPERSRWTVAQTLDEDGNHKCTACLACERACPDHVIQITLTVGEDKTKHIDHWRYESAACMMCGLCVEACSFDAIHQTHDYELAHWDFSTFTYDQLADVDAAKPKRAERPERPAKPQAATESASTEAASSVAAPPAETAKEAPDA